MQVSEAFQSSFHSVIVIKKEKDDPPRVKAAKYTDFPQPFTHTILITVFNSENANREHR